LSRAILPLLLWLEVILLAVLLGPIAWRVLYPKRTRELDRWAEDVRDE
jgi:hypothetical protein